MNYWEGAMNWPVIKDWHCQTCGSGSWYLEWGMVHGICRCANCHTEYSMLDSNKTVIAEPICRLKSEYIEPAKAAWQQLGKSVDAVTDAEWRELGVPEGV